MLRALLDRGEILPREERLVSIAGNGDTYTLAVVPPSSVDGLREAGSTTFVTLDRVTSVIGKTLGKDGALMGWAYGLGLDAGIDAAKAGLDLAGWDRDQLKAYAKDRGITPWRKRDAAASRGTAAHYVAELYASGDEAGARKVLETLDESVRGYAEAALAYLEANRRPIIGVERQLFSLAHRFAGTIDLLLKEHVDRGDGIVVADFKTSRAVYESHAIQLGAYAIAVEELGWGPVVGGVVILLREDGRFEEVAVEPLPQAFLGLLSVYRSLREYRGQKGEQE